MTKDTVWVLGDQLRRDLGALAEADPRRTTVLFVESEAKLRSKRWHRQRLHVVLSSMRHLAAELRDEGFTVDERRAPTLAAGLEAHRRDHAPEVVRAMEPASFDGLALLRRLGVELVRSDQYLCHWDDFSAWAGDRAQLRMEDFYRWQRRRLGYLMDGDEPVGGRWNYDAENRQPPPRGAHEWPAPTWGDLDEIDEEVTAELEAGAAAGRLQLWGEAAQGWWPTSRAAALRRLDHIATDVLPAFGPHEDAMLTSSWHLAHTLLSAPMNLGLLSPAEVADTVEDAYRSGGVPIASAEGLMRQVIGWREYVWGVYWRWMPEYRAHNVLGAERPLPPAYLDGATDMRCLHHVVTDIAAHGWTHHIQRLMILGNLSLLAGVRPDDLVEWMWATFVDGAEWVMLPNVVGMALYADGGRMSTKPYAAGGAYIGRMSDYCGGCRYDRRRRTGDDACPYTTLYWDFLARHRKRFAGNHRMRQQLSALDRLDDLPAVRARAAEVLALLDAGQL